MAGGLPPPPTRAANGDFAWTAWYNQLYTLLSTSGSVSWSLVNKAGSSIADLANHSHGLLTSILGTGSYHISSSEATNVTALPTAASIVTKPFKTKAGAIVVGDIPAGEWAIYKDTVGLTLKLYANDGGVLKSVALV